MADHDRIPQKKSPIKRLLSQLLLLLLAISFGAWGIGDMLRGNVSNYVAKVGDRPITVYELQNEVAHVKQNAQGQLPDEFLNTPIFTSQIRTKLLQDALIEEAAKYMGITPDAATVVDELKRDPYFQDLRGEFDPKALQAFLQNQRMSEGALMENVSRQLRARTLVYSFQLHASQQFPALSALQQFHDGQTRDIRIIHINARDIDTIPPLDDAALEDAYATFNPQDPFLPIGIDHTQFSAEETRDITLITLQDTDITAQAKAQLSTHENAEDAPLLANAKAALAQSINNQLDDAIAEGLPLKEALASLPVKAHIQDFTALTATNDVLPDKARKAAFTLDEGQISPIDSTKGGDLFLVKVTHITPFQAKRPFNEVKKVFKTVRENLAVAQGLQTKLYQIYGEYSEATDDAAKQAVLKKHGISSNTLTGFGRADYARSGLPQPTYQRLFDAENGAVILPKTQQDAGEEKAPTKFSFAHVLAIHAADKAKATTNISAESQNSAVNNMQSFISNGLLQSFEKDIPVTLYNLPVSAGAQGGF